MYAVMSILGLLFAGRIFCKRIRKETKDDTESIIFLIVLSIGMLIGGHALYACTNFKNLSLIFKASSFSELMLALRSAFGGMVFYGGLIGAYILGIIYVKVRKLDVMLYTDSVALFAPTFHGFARIGCFLGGCCYGIESKIGFAASGNTITNIGEARRFPIQLLEAALNFIIAIIIFYLLEKQKLKGQAFYFYLSLYAVVRFFDEFLRGDEIRGFIFGLSTSQFISIFVEIFALVMLFLISRKKKTDVVQTSVFVLGAICSSFLLGERRSLQARGGFPTELAIHTESVDKFLVEPVLGGSKSVGGTFKILFACASVADRTRPRVNHAEGNTKDKGLVFFHNNFQFVIKGKVCRTAVMGVCSP